MTTSVGDGQQVDSPAPARWSQAGTRGRRPAGHRSGEDRSARGHGSPGPSGLRPDGQETDRRAAWWRVARPREGPEVVDQPRPEKPSTGEEGEAARTAHRHWWAGGTTLEVDERSSVKELGKLAP